MKNEEKKDDDEIRLNSIDIKIFDKIKETNDFDFYDNLNYDEEEKSNLLKKKIALHTKSKDYTIIILVLIIILLIGAIIILIILISFLKTKDDDNYKCYMHCKCENHKCIKCDNEDIYFKIEERCLLKNYSFISMYYSNISNETINLINDEYKSSTEIRIENGENGMFLEERINNKDNLSLIYTFENIQNIVCYFLIKVNNSTESMFQNINRMTLIYFTNFDTQNVETMKSMFGFCSDLTSIDISGINTINVTTMN